MMVVIEVECEKCSGTGEVVTVDNPFYPKQTNHVEWIRAECPVCSGTGEVNAVVEVGK